MNPSKIILLILLSTLKQSKTIQRKISKIILIYIKKKKKKIEKRNLRSNNEY